MLRLINKSLVLFCYRLSFFSALTVDSRKEVIPRENDTWVMRQNVHEINGHTNFETIPSWLPIKGDRMSN